MMDVDRGAVQTTNLRSTLKGTRHPEDKWIYLVLFIVLALFLCFGLIEVYSTEGLFSYDPNYHMNLSELLEQKQEIITEIQLYEGSSPPQYLTSMQLLTALLHQYTGLSYLTIYRTFGLFCRIFTALVLFITASYFLQDKRYGLAAVILFISSSYIFYRSLISYPENLVLPFQILIFHAMIKSLREGEIDYALPVYISAALYIHYRSFIVPALLLLVFLIFKRNIKYAAGLSLCAGILAAPILQSAIDQYIKYYHINVGPSASWKPYTVGNPSYAVPTFNYYLSQLGALLILLMLLGIPFLLRRINAEKLILLLWLTFTFAMTRGKSVGLYVPTDRMLVYFCVPAALVAALFLKEGLDSELRSPRARMAAGSLMSLALVFFLVVNMPGIHGWVGIGADKRDAAAWLNENASDNAVIIPFQLDLVTMGVDRLGSIDIFKGGELEDVSNAPGGVKEKIGELYPEKKVYIVSGTDDFQVHDAEVVFQEGKIRIYYYESD